MNSSGYQSLGKSLAEVLASMERLGLIIATAALLITTVSHPGTASGPFDQRLSPDRQVLQALNRLAFGPRPGDVEEVRRMGVAKWIELQLHPERIPENPDLDAKLKPLETLRMSLPEIVTKYTPAPQQPLMMASMTTNPLPQDEMRKLRTGTAEQRKALLASLPEDKRRQALMRVPRDSIDDLPEYKQEAEDARKMQQEEIQKQARRANPRLQDILDPEQMKVARSGSPEELTALFASLDPEKRPLVAAMLPPQKAAAFPELRREGNFKRAPRLVASEDAKEAKVFRAIESNRQLEEVLVDFWFNHFNVDQAKSATQTAPNLIHLLIGSYERDAIRPHVLGHFRDLLLATARHPAMLYYLDNWESVAPGAFQVGPFAPNRATVNGVPNSIIPSLFDRQAHGLNENYGREVMELHTLGVNGGYTQADVIALARCFTGWTVRNPEDPEFLFASFMHDFGEKTLLGHKIPAGGGEQDGIQALDILARHPSTARFISRELAQRFVADDPPPALVDRMAKTFTKTDGDLRAVLETMFTSPEFFSEGAWQAKVKSPFEMVVSAVRAVGGEVSDPFTLVQKLADLGQPLYNKLEPNGYPNTGESWFSTVGIMGRLNFAADLTAGKVPGIKVDSSRLSGKDNSAIARSLLGRDASSSTEAAIEKGLEGKDHAPLLIASLVIGSPEFQRR
ncbi:MAG TPA: DUF1800 domain-containing protein [Bryobacteraceae bacterium]|nr:DUF1800 domain-containing protein [Bryobacteraceae bacterium]